MNLLKNQPARRRKKIEILRHFLKNHGRFSVLVLGNRGTGKKYWTHQIAQDSKKKSVLINAALSQPTIEYWKQKFEEAHEGILVISDVEKLSKESQSLLREGLATRPNEGKFGFEDKKIYEIQPVFTSSKNISELRDTEQYLNAQFFDRIAQLVVKFPSFKDMVSNHKDDLQSCWNTFGFDTEYPQALEDWLDHNIHKLHGNFRDLHKMCINWNVYQEMGWDNPKILGQIKKDFDELYHIPEQNKHSIFEVHFTQGKTYKDFQEEFRNALKHWVDEEFPSRRKGAEALDISYRTFERW